MGEPVDMDEHEAPGDDVVAHTKKWRRDGVRTTPPGQTVARVRALMKPLGITRVANVTGLDCIGIPVVMVCRPNAKSLAVSQGKGIDVDASRASGLMEALELFHAERAALPLRLTSWNELRFSHEVVPIERLARISAGHFHQDRALLWCQGSDLFTSETAWIPYELVHMNYTLPLPSGSGCFVMSSNGLASGNHLFEAVIHGLCEVIERDAITLFRFHEIDRQESLHVDTRTVTDGPCRALLRLYEEAGVAVGVWDATSDVGVAAFRCVIVDREASPFRVMGPVEGMGCHLTREEALRRALTEAAQARLTVIAGSRDDTGRHRYVEARDGNLIQRARERLRVDGRRPFDATPTSSNETLEEDLAVLLRLLARAGLDRALVVDLSKPEFGIPVVRVVVPGLETYHHVEGYTPGERAQRALAGRLQGVS